ncbi:uncharacterized protein LOC122646273 isoform X2 [Telopea speciosissima]|uniref:uncharacterized protein LOC122646273 isoform X2 n=1 Tax=Telopea speciosissima TaxID=54955 RepID=UPI001CC60958|nr:uncharacterized protein LOC122646273 isoform X2 [Telopea speciosissima]
MAGAPCEEDQDVYSISVISERGNTNPQLPSQFSLLSFLEVPYASESKSGLDNDWNDMTSVSFQMESADRCSSCSVDIDVEEKNLSKPKTEEKTAHCSIKTESALTSTSQRKISIQIGGKIMQLLLNHNPILLKPSSRDKSVTEGAHDTTNSRWRRYKRTASLDSRKVVVFSSVLSSMGTLLLIYLTLRVKQIGDGLVHA